MKEQLANRPWRIIENIRAAHVLAYRGEARFLEPFFGREQSLSEAASELSMSVKALYPKVKHLETLGLVRVVRSEPRAGKAVKYYRSSADDFFVPAHVLPVEVGLTKGEAYWHNRLRRSVLSVWLKQPGEPHTFGLRVFLSGKGRMQFVITPDPSLSSEHPTQDFFTPELPVVYQWRTLRLNKMQARELQRQMSALLEPYTAQQDPEEETYIIRLAMAPLVAE